jgi:hypothetical protein
MSSSSGQCFEPGWNMLPHLFVKRVWEKGIFYAVALAEERVTP